MTEDFTYDIECYPNFFSLAACLDTRKDFEFEISEWKDDSHALYMFLLGLIAFKHRMVGFNNAAYDYMLIDFFMEYQGQLSYKELYAKSQAYFRDGKNVRFNPHAIPDWNHRIPQIDLFKIHHFDNKAKRTSLKMIEFNMRSWNIKDLPFDPLLPLTYPESRILMGYNHHDKAETEKFRLHTQPMIEFRDKLSIEHNRDFTNFSDSKIGSEFFVMELHKHGIPKKIGGILNQTRRDFINLGDVILPYVKFYRPEFNRIVDFFRVSTIQDKESSGLLALKGFFGKKKKNKEGEDVIVYNKKLECIVDGFQFDFGAGGIHGSLKKSIIRESETHDLLDWDVASYYPNLAIKNKFHPEHLTELFCEIYEGVYNQRKGYAKKTPENAMLKLALNSVYGNSSSEFSSMLDQKFTMSITINGQLLLCMLAEQLMNIPDLKMIQVNTDGLTILCPKTHREFANRIWKWWEEITGLELEEAEYKAMYIRDVNNYMAEYKDGGVKRIGCYAHELALHDIERGSATRELGWHKNHGARVVALAAEAALVHGIPIPEFISRHEDEFDFMLRTKVPRSSRLELRTEQGTQQLQNISRYYVSHGGGKLIKIMPYTENMTTHWHQGDHYEHETTGEYQVVKAGKKPKSGKFKRVAFPELTKMPPREIGINTKQLVTDCSSMDDFKRETINFNYYIAEARKIVDPLLLGE